MSKSICNRFELSSVIFRCQIWSKLATYRFPILTAHFKLIPLKSELDIFDNLADLSHKLIKTNIYVNDSVTKSFNVTFQSQIKEQNISYLISVLRGRYVKLIKFATEYSDSVNLSKSITVVEILHHVINKFVFSVTDSPTGFICQHL